MRRLSQALLAIVFVVLVFGAGTQDDPWRVYNTETVAIVFDDTYTATGVTLDAVDVEIAPESGTPITVWTFMPSDWTLDGTRWKIPIRQRATPLPNGKYQMRVRAWDTFGNVSGWCPVVWINKQWRPIDPPHGCTTVR